MIDVDKEGVSPARKKALRNAALLGLLALVFYLGIFFLVKWRHV